MVDVVLAWLRGKKMRVGDDNLDFGLDLGG